MAPAFNESAFDYRPLRLWNMNRFYYTSRESFTIIRKELIITKTTMNAK